jgi:hypothetical protein
MTTPTALTLHAHPNAASIGERVATVLEYMQVGSDPIERSLARDIIAYMRLGNTVAFAIQKAVLNRGPAALHPGAQAFVQRVRNYCRAIECTLEVVGEVRA